MLSEASYGNRPTKNRGERRLRRSVTGSGSRIRKNTIIMALTATDITVAHATPSTPIPKRATKHPVEHHIAHCSHEKRIKRQPSVAYRTHYGRPEIVDHRKRHAVEIYSEIPGGKIYDIGGVDMASSIGRANKEPSTRRIAPDRSATTATVDTERRTA